MSDSDKNLRQRKVRPVPLGEAFTTDMTKLKDAELRDYIVGVKEERLNTNILHGTNPIDVVAVLMLAAAEQNSRSTRRLMWTAIGIAIVSTIISTLGWMGKLG